jgi:hypothetical protein
MAGGLFSAAKLFGMTIRESATDGSDFTNPDADYRRLFLGEDGQLHVKDSAGAVTDIGIAGATVATDTIWDAAGDLAVGSGANTAAKLTKGAAGGALSIINATVAWNSGTSFPGSKLTGDRYWRTDTQLFEFGWALTAGLAASSSEVPGSDYPLLNTATIWLVDWRWSYLVGTTHTGTQYWTSTLTGYTDGQAFSTLTTDKATANLMVNPAPTAIGTLAGSASEGLYILVTKVSTPSNLLLGTSWAIRYRLVLT